MRRSGSVKFVVPKGWTQEGWTQPDKIEGADKPVYILADNHVYTFGLNRGKTEIILFLTNNAEFRCPPQDSRRLLWKASRYASTWNLPLYQWSTAPEWNVYQTNGSRLLISGASPRYEFLCSAHIVPPVTDRDILATLEELFRSTISTSGQPFAHLSARDIHFRLMSPPVAGNRWVLGETALRIPSGWIVEDMVLPYILESDATYTTLNLSRRDFHTQAQNLLIMWIRGNEINRGNNRQIAINWESRVKRWQTHPEILTNPAPIQGRDAELFVGVTDDSHGMPREKGRWKPAWVYKSPSLALLATGWTPDADSVGMMEDAVTDIIKQLI